jgi:small GTP-binding protein
MVLGGSAGSGKTSFLTGKPALDSEYENLGVSFKPIECIVNKGDIYQLICWDLKTREKYRFLYPIFCRGASCAILCFDISSKKSFDELPYWIKIIRKDEANNNFKIPIILIGNKIDLNNLKVSNKDIYNLIKSYKIDALFFTSIYDEDKKRKKTVIFKKLLERLQPFYQIQDLTIFIPKDDDDFKKFLNFFSKCPLCGKKNEYDSLKDFYYNRDPSLISIREKLVDLIEESEDIEILYKKNIKFGIPCCRCFEENFKS